MRILSFSSTGGASGDMILGVMLNLGVDVKVLHSLMYRVWNYWKDNKRSHIFMASEDGKSGKTMGISQ